MRIAWIDYDLEFVEIFKRQIEREYVVQLFRDISLDEFERAHGFINEFDGALVHPGIDNQKYFINDFPREHPNLRFALISPLPQDYKNERIPVLSYFKMKSVAEFFGLEKKLE